MKLLSEKTHSCPARHRLQRSIISMINQQSLPKSVIRKWSWACCKLDVISLQLWNILSGQLETFPTQLSRFVSHMAIPTPIISPESIRLPSNIFRHTKPSHQLHLHSWANQSDMAFVLWHLYTQPGAISWWVLGEKAGMCAARSAGLPWAGSAMWDTEYSRHSPGSWYRAADSGTAHKSTCTQSAATAGLTPEIHSRLPFLINGRT